MAAALLTLLAFNACKKDNAYNGRIRIFAEQMHSNSKVNINPENINAAQWVVGETVNVNDISFTIGKDQYGYYLSPTAPNNGGLNNPQNLYAIYPASMESDNIIEVSNDNDGSGDVMLTQLTINLKSDGTQDVIFPMAASASANAGTMVFQHLTAGMKVTITNNSGNSIILGSLKVVAQSNTTMEHLALGNFTASWALQGPSLPSGEPGSITEDQNVSHSSEMNLVLKSNGNPNVTIANGESITLCAPLTASTVERLVISGYDENGAQKFVRTMSLEDPITITRNVMYKMPTIVL